MLEVCFECINKTWNNKLSIQNVVLDNKLTVCEMCHQKRKCVLKITVGGLNEIAHQIKDK